MATIREINWFPGHMRKALNRIQEKLKQCDGVIEIGDARAPFSSFPDYLDRLTEGKLKVFVFSKIDLADPVLSRISDEENERERNCSFLSGSQR